MVGKITKSVFTGDQTLPSGRARVGKRSRERETGSRDRLAFGTKWSCVARPFTWSVAICFCSVPPVLDVYSLREGVVFVKSKVVHFIKFFTQCQPIELSRISYRDFNGAHALQDEAETIVF